MCYNFKEKCREKYSRRITLKKDSVFAKLCVQSGL